MAEERNEAQQEGDLGQEMEQTIRDTLATIRTRDNDAETTAAIAPDKEATAPAKAEPAKDEPAAGEKARDKDGKFAKQPEKTDSAAPAEAPAATEPKPGTAEPEAAEPDLKFGAVTIDLKRPPSSWKPGAKSQWNALPEDVRREVYRREADFSNSVLNGPMKQNADFGQSMRTAFEPYRMLIESEGSTPEKAFTSLLQTAALYRTGTPQQKLQNWLALAQQYNIPVRDWLATQGAQQPAIGQPQPQAQQIADPRVDTILASLQRQESETRMRAENAATSATAAFYEAKNEKGEPLYPFVDNVSEDMTHRVGVIRAANPSASHDEILKTAYEQAVWANPETRAVLIAHSHAATTAQASTAAKVVEAKRAQVGTMPKRGALPAKAPEQSIDDTIRETGRALGMFN